MRDIMDVTKLLIYMDSLRYERNLKQEEFLHDIVSQRQYYRYLSGQSEPPFNIIIALAKRLNLTLDRLVDNYIYTKDKNRKKVQHYFNLVLTRQFEKATKEQNEIQRITHLDDYSTIFFKLGIILQLFYNKKVSKLHLSHSIKNIIKFDKIIKHDSLQDVELYGLGLLMEYSEIDREIILKRVLKLYHDNKIMLTENRLYIAQMYFWIIKNLGRLHLFEKVIELSNKAINYCSMTHSIYLLPDFHYYKALAYYKLNNINKFKATLCDLSKLLQVCKKEKNILFKHLVLKDTNYDIDLI